MKSQGRPSNSFALIQLPPGKLLLTRTLPLDVNYVILRGAGNDPNNGGTTLEFRPDENTRYDTLTANGARWDMEGTGFDYTYMEDDGRGGSRERSGSASGGWYVASCLDALTSSLLHSQALAWSPDAPSRIDRCRAKVHSTAQ